MKLITVKFCLLIVRITRSSEVIGSNDASALNQSEDVLDTEEKYHHYHSFYGQRPLCQPQNFALTLGIKANRFDWLVFTGSNCMHHSNQWLKHPWRTNFASQTQIRVIGVQRIRQAKGWLPEAYRVRYIISSFTLSGFARRKPLYMGIGRNMAS